MIHVRSKCAAGTEHGQTSRSEKVNVEYISGEVPRTIKL